MACPCSAALSASLTAMTASTPAGRPAAAVPSVIEDALVFVLDDPERRFTQVTLECDDAVPGRRRFRRTRTGWMLSLPRPDLNRLEYLLVVTDRRGRTEVVCDPANPERVSTAFGARSVALMPGYERPAWMQATVPGRSAGSVSERVFTDPVIGDLPITVWAPDGLRAGDPARLLVVHDGPEYVELAGLAQYAAAVIAQGVVPPFRMALLHPVERDPWYSANEDYVAAELAALDDLVATVTTIDGWVAFGASLGGVTSLLAAFAGDERFTGLMAQSGSFFTPDLDAQESTYPYFARVVAAVAAVQRLPRTERPLHISLTCGRLEENFANNDAMAAALAEQGHLVSFTPVQDLHNYTAWRDSLDPWLSELLRATWSPGWLAT